MTEFEPLWSFITKRAGGETNCVQERHELEHVFNLIKACDCQSYLEIGAAEGNSLHVLGHAVKQGGKIVYVDYGEAHTKDQREEILTQLRRDYQVGEYMGDSTNPKTFSPLLGGVYDCVLIDGGHDVKTVLSDAIIYAPMARKYVFFHDVQLPAVREAVNWFVERWKIGKYTTYINSSTYGFGILEIGKQC